MMKNNEIVEYQENKDTKKIVEKKLLRFKPSIISNYSGIIVTLLFIVVCYLSVTMSKNFVWLLFGIVSMPILRRNYNDTSVIILGLGLVVCATVGIIINGLSPMVIAGDNISISMSYGISLLGLLYLSIITFYKGIKLYEMDNSILFYIIVIVSSYPILIATLFLGSLIGFLGETILKAIIYIIIVIPVIMAVYLIMNRNKKVVEVKYDEEN